MVAPVEWCFSELENDVSKNTFMKSSRRSRREFIKTSALGAGALGMASAVPKAYASLAVAPSNMAAPASDIAVWYTNPKQRFVAGQPIHWQTATTPAASESIQLAPANKFQDILGFGGCFTDASCYLISQLRQRLRDELLHSLFHPSEMGLSVNRTCIGSSDSAATLYSYDDG